MTRFGFVGALAALAWFTYGGSAHADGVVWSDVGQLGSGGDSIAISNDTIVTGRRGAAVFWKRTTPTTWTQVGLVSSESGGALGAFVAIDGNTAIVGQPSTVGPGQALVATYNGKLWNKTIALTANDNDTSVDHFGFSVAISGDLAVVAAPWKKVGESANQGAVYTFVRSGDHWQADDSALFTPEGGADDGFGSALAVADSTLVVGAPDSASGRAYVFSRVDNAWAQQVPALLPPSNSGAMNFGNAVAISGDNILIGADGQHWLTDIDGITRVATVSGHAYVFTRDRSDWETLPIELENSAPLADDHFGGSVALAGDVALVGSPHGNRPTPRVFVRACTTWVQQGPRLFVNDWPYTYQGGGVALSDGLAVVGGIFHQLQLPFDDSPPAPERYLSHLFAPREDAIFCDHDSDCPAQLYCADIGVCEPRLEAGGDCSQCKEANCRACKRSHCWTDGGMCVAAPAGATCNANQQCLSLSCVDSICAEGEGGAGGEGGEGGEGAASDNESSGGTAGTHSPCAGGRAGDVDHDAPESKPSLVASAAGGCGLARSGGTRASLLFALFGLLAAAQRRHARGRSRREQERAVRCDAGPRAPTLSNLERR